MAVKSKYRERTKRGAGNKRKTASHPERSDWVDSASDRQVKSLEFNPELEAAGTDLANELARIEGQLEAMAKRRRA